MIEHEDRRKHDESFELLKKILSNQETIVLPALVEIKSIKKTLYGNGEVGVCERLRRIERIPKTLAWTLGILSTGIGVWKVFF